MSTESTTRPEDPVSAWAIEYIRRISILFSVHVEDVERIVGCRLDPPDLERIREALKAPSLREEIRQRVLDAVSAHPEPKAS